MTRSPASRSDAVTGLPKDSIALIPLPTAMRRQILLAQVLEMVPVTHAAIVSAARYPSSFAKLCT